MTDYNGEMKPDESVERMALVIDKLDRSMSGGFYHRDGHVLPW